MKTPGFWYKKSSGFEKILSPVADLYTKLGRRHREKSQAKKLAIPVICVGNIVSGGSGKTPTAIALLQLIQSSKISLSPFFLTRGYRGKISGPERVDDTHDPALWGDEALLLSRYAPTVVSKNRYAGGMLAQNLEADLILMDDGMQNYSLTKDITFCVVDGTMGFGNEAVVPQGPLRQPLEDGYSLTDAFIIIGTDEQNLASKIPPTKPTFHASLKVKSDFNLSKTQPYIAFCGIGFPQKFETSLKNEGLNIIDFKSFGDHHGYTPRDIVDLGNLAEKKNARLITTEKDYARLPDFFRKQFVDVLPVEIIFDNPDMIVDFIKDKLNP